jgi:hypothetical protein
MAIVCGKRAHEHNPRAALPMQKQRALQGVGEASRGVREDILSWWLY